MHAVYHKMICSTNSLGPCNYNRGGLEASSIYSTAHLCRAVTVWKAHLLWRLRGLLFWVTSIKVKGVTTTETVKSKYQLMNGKRHLNSILSAFSTDIFLNNVSTISIRRWSGMNVGIKFNCNWLYSFLVFSIHLLDHPVTS